MRDTLPVASLDSSQPLTCILVVDDDSTIRKLTRRMLEGRGYMVLTAIDGAAALRAVAASMEQPGSGVHLVLTDIDMPGSDGYALGRQLTMRWPALGVIYMSGTTHGLARRAGLGPQEHFIQKPFAAGDLLPKLERVLSLAGNRPAGNDRREDEVLS